MSEEWNAEVTKTLLDAFSKQVPPRRDRPPTFMEISGYPHYENVCSNILAFFFDPENPHGFGRLFLDALLAIGGKKDQVASLNGDVRVHREVHTKGEKYIDLLIESESHAILIENKIYARTDYNPWEDYARYVDSLERPNIFKYLLTIVPIAEDLKNKIDQHGFRNIAYSQLISNIRGRLGHYAAGADTRYLTFTLDFLNTIDNFVEGIRMNRALVDFLKKEDNTAEVQRFYEEIDAYKDELRKMVTQLGHLTYVTDLPKPWKWREKYSLFDILVHEIEHSSFKDDNIVVNTIINPEGWTFTVFLRNEPADPGEWEKLKELLVKLEIPWKDVSVGERFTLTKAFEYDKDRETIAQFVRCIVKKLATDGPAS